MSFAMNHTSCFVIIVAYYKEIADSYMPACGYEFYLQVFNSRYGVEHENINFISTSGRIMFCLLYKHTNTDVFADFPKISDHFAKISKDFSKIVPKATRTFPNIFRRFSKITEDFRGGTDDVSIIHI